MKTLPIIIVSLFASLTAVSAADLVEDAVPVAQCTFAGSGGGSSQLSLIENNGELTTQVVSLMDEAITVAESDEWIASRSTAFRWASETKVACGKAYGYLKTGYRDEDTLNKCDCFHNQMRHAMN